MIDFIRDNIYFILNCLSAFTLGFVYSLIELQTNFKSGIVSIFRLTWGWIYLILNGLVAFIALLTVFYYDLNTAFQFSEIIVAGTSGLAMLRVISVKSNVGDTENKVIPLIEAVLNLTLKNYDRARSSVDLETIKPLMAGIDAQKAAASIPILCATLMNTLTKEDGLKMNEEIQKVLNLQQENSFKSLTLGIILAKYVGIKLLTKVVDQTRDFITEGEEAPKMTLNELIKKFEQ